MFALLSNDRGIELGDVRLRVFLEITLAHFTAETDQPVVVDIVDLLVQVVADKWLAGDNAGGRWIDRELRFDDLLIQLRERSFKILLKLGDAHLATKLDLTPVIGLDDRVAHASEFLSRDWAGVEHVWVTDPTSGLDWLISHLRMIVVHSGLSAQHGHRNILVPLGFIPCIELIDAPRATEPDGFALVLSASAVFFYGLITDRAHCVDGLG